MRCFGVLVIVAAALCSVGGSTRARAAVPTAGLWPARTGVVNNTLNASPGALVPDIAAAAAAQPSVASAATAGACTTDANGAIACNVYEKNNKGGPSDISAVFKLPHPVFPGYIVFVDDPAKPTNDRSNWSDILHFLADPSGYSTSYQLLSKGCNAGSTNVGCFPSYASVVAPGNTLFMAEVQQGTGYDSEDWTPYYAAPNTYNVYSAARFGPPASGYAAANWAFNHLYGPGSLAVQPSDPHNRYLGVGHTWKGFCLGFVDTAWQAATGSFIADLGVVGPNATATGAYNAYNAAGLIHTTGIPPVGALVFYPYPYLVLSGAELTDGHIAISYGNGDVISALETLGAGALGTGYVQIHPYDFLRGPGPLGHGAYAGWAFPPNAP